MARQELLVKEEQDVARGVEPAHLVTERATAPAVMGDANASMFERLLRDPDVTPDRLERFMALWERTEAKRAEMAFNRALAAAQKEMRPVAADAYNPQTRSKYASYKALDDALRPIYTKHGLAVSFPGTEDSPLPEHIRVICKVTHDDGHAERYHVDMPADGKGAKGGDVMTKTHAVGSGMSYGQRYLLKGIFNVAVGEDDDDGNRASGKSAKPESKAPTGYDAWLEAAEAVAVEGWTAYAKFWNEPKSKPFRKYLVDTNPVKANKLQQQAKGAGH